MPERMSKQMSRRMAEPEPQPIVDFARLLDEAGVSNVLWGWHVVTPLGHDDQIEGKGQEFFLSIPKLDEVKFVIPDDQQSRLLWHMPTIQLAPPKAEDRIFIASNDPRLKMKNVGSRTMTWRDVEYPGKTFTPLGYCEAMMWLICKDHDHQEFLNETWKWMLDFLASFYDVELKDHIDPQFRPVWVMRRENLKNKVWTPVEPLRKKLIKENKLDSLST
ncbi:hypothetical protein BDV19DRAFT_389102 [Aspergillus venezuelensis]